MRRAGSVLLGYDGFIWDHHDAFIWTHPGIQ
jgi:hypothetical protein